MFKSAVESLGLILFSVLQYRLVKHGTMWNTSLTFSVFKIFTLVTFNAIHWFGKLIT